MKKIFTVISILLFAIVSKAQNLVPNFSFEQGDSCPTYFNESSYEYSLGCVSWGQATSDPADYYNACDTAAVSIGRVSPWVGVPNNQQGNQTAFEGAAYTGIAVFDTQDFNFKQYIITNIPALQIDTAYEVTVHVSLADSSRFATDGMGVFFTTYGSPNQSTLGTLIETPQIDFTSYGIISDTANWTTLTSTFIADSAYTSLMIGVFKPASEMHIIGFNSNAHKFEPISAYYYIDNVVVEKLSSTAISLVNNSSIDAKIYPNPFTDHSTLIFNNPYSLSYSLSIFNIQGQVVQHINNITSSSLRIERNNLPSGFYYYQLGNENNIVANGKFFIK